VEEKIFFVSDLHLGLEDKEREELKEKLFCQFLTSLSPKNSRLFIVGDLFDYWFEYKLVLQKGYYRTFTAIKNFTEEGGKVDYLIGNHDFLHRDFFEKELNVRLHENNLEVYLNGKKFYLAHGDGLLKNDTGYKILKKIFRNKTLQTLYSWIHPDLGIALASKISRASREYTTEKNYGTEDGLVEVAEKLIEKGFDFVIFGHSHVRQFKKFGKGIYVNLGSWIDAPCFWKYAEGQFEIIDLGENG